MEREREETEETLVRVGERERRESRERTEKREREGERERERELANRHGRV